MGAGPSAIKRRGPLLVGEDSQDYSINTYHSYAGYSYDNKSRENNKKKHKPCGCFSIFCPPGNERERDPLGSPMPPTPPNQNFTNQYNGYSNGKRNTNARKRTSTRRSSRYGGLEVETNSIGHDNDNGFFDDPASESKSGQNGHRYVNHNGHHNYNPYHQNQSQAASADMQVPFIYDGPDGEQRFMRKYQMSEVLGVGSTSICHRCVDRNTGKSYACKIIDKQQIEARFEGMLSQFKMEIAALQKLSTHPNIIQLYDVYTTNTKIYIVMELMAGGELFDYVVQKGTLTEAEASAIVRMVTSALVYMHDQNIIHRDLKPENLLLTHKPNSIYDIEVKIIDFGLSKVCKVSSWFVVAAVASVWFSRFSIPIPDSTAHYYYLCYFILSKQSMSEPLATTFLGTRGYLAPEMLQRRNYSKAVDTWALGVIVFVLLCGCLPFDDDSTSIPSDALVRSKFTLRFPRWARNLSPSAKDLLSHLLDVNPASRYSAEDAMDHPWVRGQTAPKDSMLHSPGRISLTPSSGGRGVGGGRSGGGYGHGHTHGHHGHRRRLSGGVPISDNQNHNGSSSSNGIRGPRMRTATEERAAANRSQMNQMIANRARANSLPRQYRQLVRKKSI